MQMSFTNPWSDKLNKGNSEQFGKFPGKNTTSCQIYKLQSKRQFERKAKMALSFWNHSEKVAVFEEENYIVRYMLQSIYLILMITA